MATATDFGQTEALFVTRRRTGYVWDVLRRLRRNRAATVSGIFILLLILVAVLADVIATHDVSESFFAPIAEDASDDPLAARETGKFATPTWDHLFGTDQLARDIFSRTVTGLRISMGAAFFAVVVVSVIGVAVGTLAVSGPTWVDSLLMRVTDIAYAFPDLLLIILLSAAFGGSIFGLGSILGISSQILLLFFAIAITAWPTTARLVRGQLLSIREMEYTTAARSIGASPLRVATRHMIPNAMGPVIVEATFLVPRAIIAEATLSFIGLGVRPPTPSLGLLINDHFSFVGVQWVALLIPTLILATLFLAFQFFGDGLRDAMDPRTEKAQGA